MHGKREKSSQCTSVDAASWGAENVNHMGVDGSRANSCKKEAGHQCCSTAWSTPTGGLLVQVFYFIYSLLRSMLKPR